MQHPRRPSRHESLLPEHSHDDSAHGWMVSYIDVMTLLVVLFVLLLALSSRFGDGLSAAEPDPGSPVIAESTPPRLGVPLPAALRQALDAGPVSPLTLHREAVSAALGVAGLPLRSPSVDTPPAPPALLARQPSPEPDTASARDLPMLALPKGLDPAAPLADYMVILTDRLPEGMEAAPEAAKTLSLAAREVAERVAAAPYLPDLEGVEVSRVPEGVRLRVEDRLLFPSAQAELTEAGRELVAERLRDVVARHPGQVAVQGHTDSRPIQTPRFPSNWALSSARAIAIVEALVEAGIDPTRLRAVGLADTRPLATNDTVEGRARNRRVEVVIQPR
ncbi:OmpA/MotB family protein [Halomonas organivorans]|uniref:Chemotaxis protein MotB n=1 Tax=Halomonas organivorans TaxID=257772 RepID=A0A7W5G624_9GAMM|nr:flagellar motor protein MotB [Halomonas organivorans]MBB3142098.1 chemotaxis protein MotB [Halomonas organivorans]